MPWAMQEYRPYRAPLRLPNQVTILLQEILIVFTGLFLELRLFLVPLR